ncbi:hypothetical protein BH11PLA1_BH11PLA1_01050 [soil metagenome]
MFDNLKMMGAAASLMKNKHKVAEAAQRVQKNLEERHITVNAPDGSVQIVMSGKSKVEAITLSAAAIAAAAADDFARAKLERTIIGAITAAQKRVIDVVKAEVEREAKDLGVPELADMAGLSKMLGG